MKILGILFFLVFSLFLISSVYAQSERVCPLGSHITTDNQGNQICVDTSGQFTGYPNIAGGLGDENTGYIVIGVVILIIIIAIIAKASRKSTAYKDLPRQDFSSEIEQQTLKKQDSKCNDCKKPIGVVKGRMVFYEYDHIDGNNNNNDPNNCQALCKNCHQMKTERERNMHRND